MCRFFLFFLIVVIFEPYATTDKQRWLAKYIYNFPIAFAITPRQPADFRLSLSYGKVVATINHHKIMKAHDFDCLSLNQMEHFTESLNSSDVVV
jgi:hypothetical protein